MNTILHIRVPGEPHSQQRHRQGGFFRTKSGKIVPRNYDPDSENKNIFRWQVKAASPMLKPSEARLGIFITVWSTKKRVQKRDPVTKRPTGKFAFQADWDNFAKFFCDALKGMAWIDDEQIDDGRVLVHREAAEGAVEILVWELNTLPK